MYCILLGPRLDPCTAARVYVSPTRSKTFSIYALAVNLCCFLRRAAATMFHKADDVAI